MDTSGDGFVDSKELRAALKKLTEPPSEVQAALKIRKQKEEAQTTAQREAEAEADAILAKLKATEEAGADIAMAAFEKAMRQKQQRCKDLFREIDTSGDEQLDLDEMMVVMERLNLSTNEDEVKKLMDHLDDDKSGTLDAGELEHAIRQFRRARWERHMAVLAKQAEKIK